MAPRQSPVRAARPAPIDRATNPTTHSRIRLKATAGNDERRRNSQRDGRTSSTRTQVSDADGLVARSPNAAHQPALARRSKLVDPVRWGPGANKRPRAASWRHTPVLHSIAEFGPRGRNWTPRTHCTTYRNNVISRHFDRGRQDLSLRPPGPQPGALPD